MDEASVYHAFGRAVAARRRALGKTQHQIATHVGLSRGSLANIELGNQKVFLHQILALVEALNLENAHQLMPTNAPFLTGRLEGRPRLTGGERLTPEQRSQVELAHAMIFGLKPNVQNVD